VLLQNGRDVFRKRGRRIAGFLSARASREDKRNSQHNSETSHGTSLPLFLAFDIRSVEVDKNLLERVRVTAAGAILPQDISFLALRSGYVEVSL